MTKKILRYAIFLLVFVMFGCCASYLNGPKKSLNLTVPEKLQRATIALLTKVDDDRMIPHCSGVWLNRHQIITAAHCIDPDVEEKIGMTVHYVEFDDVKDPGQPFVRKSVVRSATVLAHDKSVDLALISAIDPSRDHHVIKIDKDTEIHIGDTVHTVGHISSYWWTYHIGNISMFRNTTGPHKNVLKTIQVSSAAWRGGSGGGLFTQDGRLIGIFGFVHTRAPNITFFIHRDVVIKFLKAAS